MSTFDIFYCCFPWRAEQAQSPYTIQYRPASPSLEPDEGSSFLLDKYCPSPPMSTGGRPCDFISYFEANSERAALPKPPPPSPTMEVLSIDAAHLNGYAPYKCEQIGSSTPDPRHPPNPQSAAERAQGAHGSFMDFRSSRQEKWDNFCHKLSRQPTSSGWQYIS